MSGKCDGAVDVATAALCAAGVVIEANFNETKVKSRYAQRNITACYISVNLIVGNCRLSDTPVKCEGIARSK